MFVLPYAFLTSPGTTLREVDLDTGILKIRTINEFEKGKIYNGGSMKVFQDLTGAKVTHVRCCPCCGGAGVYFR